MKNSDAGKTAIAEAQKIADAIENKGTLKISRLKKEQQLRQKKQIEESCGAKKKAALTLKKTFCSDLQFLNAVTNLCLQWTFTI